MSGAYRPTPALRQERVFDIDTEHCPKRGGALKIIASIEEPALIVRILSHLGRPARAAAVDHRASTIVNEQLAIDGLGGQRYSDGRAAAVV